MGKFLNIKELLNAKTIIIFIIIFIIGNATGFFGGCMYSSGTIAENLQHINELDDTITANNITIEQLESDLAKRRSIDVELDDTGARIEQRSIQLEQRNIRITEGCEDIKSELGRLQEQHKKSGETIIGITESEQSAYGDLRQITEFLEKALNQSGDD